MVGPGSLDNATLLLILVLGIFILKLSYTVKEGIMLTSHYSFPFSLLDFSKVRKDTVFLAILLL